ncbi:MAG: NADH-quinone oxidoreductase subunit J [Armatimonadota bacterium]|nr:NADH-quinone oxidoreductase subunit J [Armatimonadota bacterium]MCX7776987.1 NADH-quinone oxidoreductase subunit J [Armatimonadota bacterium]MDW8024821.1 NADH-quinone oxidoreductase subunit J [Armatimonadota bacterium]
MNGGAVWWVFFYALSAFTLFNALLVVTGKNLFKCALHLMLVFLGVAGLFLLQGAFLLAGVQTLIYTGGVTTLILFAIMLSEEVVGRQRQLVSRGVSIGISAAICFLGIALTIFGTAVAQLPENYGVHIAPVAQFVAEASHLPMGNVRAVGVALLTQFLVPFEFASVLLVVAVIGAIVIARLAGGK